MENSLLKCNLGGRDKDEEADPVKGAKVQVLCAGVGYSTNMGQQLSSHCQLDGTHLSPINRVFYTNTKTNFRPCHLTPMYPLTVSTKSCVLYLNRCLWDLKLCLLGCLLKGVHVSPLDCV